MKRLSRKERNLEKFSRVIAQHKEYEQKEKLLKKSDVYQRVSVDDAFAFANEHISEVKVLPNEEAFDAYMGKNNFRIDNLNLGKIWFAIQHKDDVSMGLKNPQREEPVKQEEPKPAVEKIKQEEIPPVEKKESIITAEVIKKFWVVSKVVDKAEGIEDILWESSPEKIGLHFIGGLKPEEIDSMWTEYPEAKKRAEELLKGKGSETNPESIRQPKPQEEIKTTSAGVKSVEAKKVNVINKIAWKGKLQDNYDGDIEQFKSYNEVYNIAKRLGFNSVEEAWEKNPMINVGTDPSELKVIKGEEKVETPKEIKKRLEELRKAITDENISTGEIAELQGLAKYIDEGDVLLLEWAGVPEFPEDKESAKKVADEVKMETDPKDPKKQIQVTYKDKPEYEEDEKRPKFVPETTEVKNPDETLRNLAAKLKEAYHDSETVKAHVADIERHAQVLQDKMKKKWGQAEKEQKVLDLVKNIQTLMEKTNAHAIDLGNDILAIASKVSDSKKQITKAELVKKLEEEVPSIAEVIAKIEGQATRIQSVVETMARYPKTKDASVTDVEKEIEVTAGAVDDLLNSVKEMYESVRGLFLDTKNIGATVAEAQ